MHQRLMVFWKTKVFCKKNIYFSTAHAIIGFIENIEKALENNIFVCEIFLDLQKVFDTVDREALLHKLSHYGIRDTAHD